MALAAIAETDAGDKRPGALRTITEVSNALDVLPHVLRFWETRFPQIRPMTRAGGRRYYRPGEVDLIAGIRHLLHVQRYTIEGAQRVLKENGVRFVQAVGRGEAVAAAPPRCRMGPTWLVPLPTSTARCSRRRFGNSTPAAWRSLHSVPLRTSEAAGLEPFDSARVDRRMSALNRRMTPTQDLIARVMRIVRTCPDAASEMLELMFLVSQIEAATHVDREYRDAKRVVSRLRNPLWEMGPADREALLKAAETIRRVCGLDDGDIPVTPTADAGERARVERRLAAALVGEFDAVQIARVTGVVAAALQE